MTLTFEDGDWIPVFRKLKKHWVWKDPIALRAWIDLLLRANHHESKFTFRASGPLIVRHRQVVATIKGLAEDWEVNRKWVRSFLRRCQGDDMLKIEFRTWDPKSNTWTDRKEDSGLMLLTVLNMPIKGLPRNEGTATGTEKVPAKGQERDSDGTAKGHIQEEGESEEPEEGEEDGAAPQQPRTVLDYFTSFAMPGKKGQQKAIDEFLRHGASEWSIKGAALRLDPEIHDFFEILREARDSKQSYEDVYLDYLQSSVQEVRRELIRKRGGIYGSDGERQDLVEVAKRWYPMQSAALSTLESKIADGTLELHTICDVGLKTVFQELTVERFIEECEFEQRPEDWDCGETWDSGLPFVVFGRRDSPRGSIEYQVAWMHAHEVGDEAAKDALLAVWRGDVGAAREEGEKVVKRLFADAKRKELHESA